MKVVASGPREEEQARAAERTACDEALAVRLLEEPMRYETLRKWTGMGLGILALAGATTLVGARARAQVPPGAPGQPGGFPGGPGFPPGFGGGMPGGMMPGMMPGGSAMAATGSRVYVLRGNTVYALDAA